MAYKSNNDTVSHFEEEKSKAKKRDEQVQEAKQTFSTYCDEKKLAIIQSDSKNNADTWKDSYLIWKALHDYAPSLWGRAKRFTQNSASVDALSTKATQDLTCYFAQKIAENPGVSISDIITYIQMLVTDVPHHFLSNKEFVMSVLCLLSGDTFALLQKLAATYAPQELVTLNNLQKQLYENVAQRLKLPIDTPRHQLRNTYFEYQSENGNSEGLSDSQQYHDGNKHTFYSQRAKSLSPDPILKKELKS